MAKKAKVDLGRPGGTTYHGTRAPKEEFMNAPVVHVGSHKSASSRVGVTWPGAAAQLHRLQFAEHVEFHPEVLTDAEANTAHDLHATAHGLRTPESVADGVPSSYNRPRVWSAVDALKANKILRYENAIEAPGDISHVVPSPSMNLKGGRRSKDPSTQHRLPMDYSMTGRETEKTSASRKGPDTHEVRRPAPTKEQFNKNLTPEQATQYRWIDSYNKDPDKGSYKNKGQRRLPMDLPPLDL